MSSSILYKFRIALNYKKLEFEGLSISAEDCKREICAKGNINSVSFDLLLQNSHTKRNYTAEELIPRNSKIIVQRVPRENAEKLPKIQSATSGMVGKTATSQPAPTVTGHVDAETFDSLTEDQRLAHIKDVSASKYTPNNYQKRTNQIMSGPPPPTYTCNRCHQPGHWYKNCPVANETPRGGGRPENRLLTASECRRGIFQWLGVDPKMLAPSSKNGGDSGSSSEQRAPTGGAATTTPPPTSMRGPSGGGKSTILTRAMQEFEGAFAFSVSQGKKRPIVSATPLAPKKGKKSTVAARATEDTVELPRQIEGVANEVDDDEVSVAARERPPISARDSMTSTRKKKNRKGTMPELATSTETSPGTREETETSRAATNSKAAAAAAHVMPGQPRKAFDIGVRVNSVSTGSVEMRPVDPSPEEDDERGRREEEAGQILVTEQRPQSGATGAVKTKVQNVNSVYSGKNQLQGGKPIGRNGGLTAIGKASGVIRRMPPPSLPSLRAESQGQDRKIAIVHQGGTGWSKSDSTSTTAAAATAASAASSTASESKSSLSSSAASTAVSSGVDARPAWAKPAAGAVAAAPPTETTPAAGYPTVASAAAAAASEQTRASIVAKTVVGVKPPVRGRTTTIARQAGGAAASLPQRASASGAASTSRSRVRAAAAAAQSIGDSEAAAKGAARRAALLQKKRPVTEEELRVAVQNVRELQQADPAHVPARLLRQQRRVEMVVAVPVARVAGRPAVRTLPDHARSRRAVGEAAAHDRALAEPHVGAGLAVPAAPPSKKTTSDVSSFKQASLPTHKTQPAAAERPKPKPLASSSSTRATEATTRKTAIVAAEKRQELSSVRPAEKKKVVVSATQLQQQPKDTRRFASASLPPTSYQFGAARIEDLPQLQLQRPKPNSGMPPLVKKKVGEEKNLDAKARARVLVKTKNPLLLATIPDDAPSVDGMKNVDGSASRAHRGAVFKPKTGKMGAFVDTATLTDRQFEIALEAGLVPGTSKACKKAPSTMTMKDREREAAEERRARARDEIVNIKRKLQRK